MKKEGFTLSELLIATSLGLICLGILYGLYRAEIGVYEFNREKMKATDRLWLTMDRIEKEVREGKRFENPINFPLAIPPDSLVFTTNDTVSFAFFTPSQDSVIYKCSSSSPEPETFAVGVSISCVSSSSATCKISLRTSWTYRKVTGEESICSKINLRNWGR